MALADALRADGAECVFLCRDLDGSRLDLLQAQGFEVRLLRSDDVTATIDAFNGDKPAWMVVDHYGLDEVWESMLRPHVGRILVIDDLANRRHDSDLLIDQNLGRRPSDYTGLVPSTCQLMIGPDYALLRPEFARLRHASLERRTNGELATLLVSMGGVDADNSTGIVLDSLARSRLSPDTTVRIVMGGKAPHCQAVVEQAAALSFRVEVMIDVADVAQVLLMSDAAIGAMGTSSWERCALGIPTIGVVVAANQEAGARALAASGAAVVIAAPTSVPRHLPAALESLLNPAKLRSMSKHAASVCDGQGTTRVVAAISHGIVVRKMQEQDLADVLEWRNDPAVRMHMRTQHEISMVEHRSWFGQCQGNPDRHLLIIEAGGTPIGFAQFNQLPPDGAEWGFYTVPGAPKGSGRKMGLAALNYAFRTLGFRWVRGEAMASNERSIGFHKALGFSENSSPDDSSYRRFSLRIDHPPSKTEGVDSGN